MMFHKGLTQEHWNTYTFFAQLANVSAEIGRSVKRRALNQHQEAEAAFLRALELLSFTILDPKNSGGKRKELCRVREFLLDHFMGDNTYKTTDADWERYFDQYAYAAALERERLQRAKENYLAPNQ